MFELSSAPINIHELNASLKNSLAGAVATFTGIVRGSNENKNVVALEYEASAELAVKEGEQIIQEAKSRFPILEAKCVHRVGKLNIGEEAVWVGVMAAHRGDAFKACRFIIDEVKKRVPIWKKEYYEKGESQWISGECCGQGDHDHTVAGYKDDTSFNINILNLTRDEFLKFKLIDIREPYERVINPISFFNCINLPNTRFQKENYSFDPDCHYLIFCEKGVRSANLVKKLRAQGHPNTYSVMDGTNALKSFYRKKMNRG